MNTTIVQKTTRTSTTLETVKIIEYGFLGHVLLSIYGYCYFLVWLLVFINNFSIFLVFAKKQRTYVKVSRTRRFYFLVIAITDLSVMLILYFPKWFGMLDSDLH